MDDVFKPDNYKKAKARIKALLGTGEIVWLGHVKIRMRQRNFTTQDILNILAYGRIMEHSLPKRHWRYTVSGTTLDGKRGTCAVEINGQLIIVTVF